MTAMLAPPPRDKATEQQLRQACAELERCLRAGEGRCAEDLLAAFPALATHPEAALELIYTEFVVRQQLGQQPQAEAWYARFPQWHEDLRQLFLVHALVCESGTGDHLSGPPTADPASQQSTWHGPDDGPGIALPHLEAYQLLGEIARGGMGVVYKARQPGLNRFVALKMIRAAEAADPEALARFRTEAAAVASLRHPNIVQIYEVGEWQAGASSPSVPFLSLEFVDGGSLQQRFAAGVLPPQQAAALLETVASAVHHAHEQGILHRDLKPANVLLTADGTPKITDFGLAKRLGEDSDGHTRTGAVLGTPAYMAPEQAGGKTQAVGPTADIYALGTILYEALTGRPPFQGESLLHTLELVRTQEPVPPRRLQPKVPRDLETICLKCLRKEPGHRYASAEVLAEDLRRFLDGRPIQARPVGRVERSWRWCRRSPVVASLLAALALLFATGSALVVWQWRAAVSALARAEREQQARALAQVNALRDAAPGAVPSLLKDVVANRAMTLPQLREFWQQGGSVQPRMRIGLALLAIEPATVRDELAAWLLEADPAEVVLVRDALTPHAGGLTERLWSKAGDPQAQPPQQLRALVALAAFAERDPRWRGLAATAIDQMLAANPLHLGIWVHALRPVRGVLLAPLQKVYREAKSPERREFAATVLADYATDRPEVLTDLLLDADPRQYAILFPLVKSHGDKVLDRLRREVQGEGSWDDALLDPSWRTPVAELRRTLEAADGLLAERWALCQTLPLERWARVAEELRGCGYRPVRLRPWAKASRGHEPPEVRVAAVWIRDGYPFHTRTDLTAATLQEHDAALQMTGLIPVDVAAYTGDKDVRFAVLWIKPAQRGAAARLHVNVGANDHKPLFEQYQAEGFIPSTIQGLPDGQNRFNGVWSKGGARPTKVDVSWNKRAEAHRGDVLLAELLLVDVDCSAPSQTAFASVWHRDPRREAVEAHGLTVGEHLQRCRDFALQGYRPAAVSVVWSKGKTVSASAWHRPFPERQQRERLARRQATAAATLLKLDAPADAWPLFRHRPDPEARSQLVWRSGLLGVDPGRLVQRLEEETDVSARRALILALGEFREKDLPAGVRERLIAKLLRWYRDDPDPGIHGAIDWLLRHSKEGPEARPVDWGQAAELQKIDQELRRRDPDGVRGWYVNQQGQTLVLLRGPVEFRMGSPADEPGHFDVERLHWRQIGRSYAIASKAVTKAQFQRFLQDRPDVRPPNTKAYGSEGDCPISGVPWYMAAQYCNWLSEQEGIPEAHWCYPSHASIKDGMKPFPDYLQRQGYRLPTEAEWEYACRAGATTSRSYGSSLELLGRHAWYQQTSQERTWPVGQKRPNDLGLFDMHGNVWTWVQDGAFTYPPGPGPVEDKEDIRNLEDRVNRALRGGSFSDHVLTVRSAQRNNSRPDNPNFLVGLRVARTYGRGG
jgi:serine/threonine protein kinase/formylglycine-generating enzyme required for sulfatase activity